MDFIDFCEDLEAYAILIVCLYNLLVIDGDLNDYDLLVINRGPNINLNTFSEVIAKAH